MVIDELRDGEVAVVVLTGRLDAAAAAQVEARLVACAREAQGTVVDLAGLDYVSSAGLRVLLKAAKAAQAARTRLMLAAPRPAVREVFEVSGFLSILPARPSRAEAIAAVR